MGESNEPDGPERKMQDRIVSPEERLRLVESLIRDRGSVRIDELASEFRVSEMTIRRDLDELETLGVARRVRGGAIALGPEAFEERHRTNARWKARIAQKLLGVIPTTGAAAFDASTTVYRAAAGIELARDLVVVTNGIDAFDVLTGKPGVEVALTGGWREPRTGSLVGPLAVRTAESVLYDVFITSAAAAHPRFGTSEATIDESEVKRAFGRSSRKIVLAVDHSKLGNRSQARLFEPGDIDVMVTDLEPEDDRLAPYRGRMRLL
jgi:DeoR family fructose operon transcriptional repressor